MMFFYTSAKPITNYVNDVSEHIFANHFIIFFLIVLKYHVDSPTFIEKDDCLLILVEKLLSFYQ